MKRCSPSIREAVVRVLMSNEPPFQRPGLILEHKSYTYLRFSMVRPLCCFIHWIDETLSFSCSVYLCPSYTKGELDRYTSAIATEYVGLRANGSARVKL